MILTALAAGAQHGYGITADREEIVDSRLRRYYRLTPSGVADLAAEASRLSATAQLATTRLRQLQTGAPQAGGRA